MTVKLKTALPPLGASITALLMLALLLGLGIWQVKRLAWKTALLQTLAEAYRSDPELTDSDFTKAASEHALFLHGHVTGQWLGRDTVLIGPRTHDGVTGYHVLTPLRLGNGGTVLVNRGWIPLNDARLPPVSDSKTVRVTGLARPPDHANIFTPANQPETNAWYIIDTAAIGTHTGLKLPLFVLYAEQVDGTDIQAPLPFAPDWQPPNNHLQYAVFWFTMAVLLTVIFGIRFFVRLE